MNIAIAAKLTNAQRELLQAVEDAHPEPLMVGRPSRRSLRVARALEHDGRLLIETDHLGFRYARLRTMSR